MRDQQGFDEFYAASVRRVTSHLHAMTGSRAEAEDAVQEAYARAWQRWGKVSGYGDFGPRPAEVLEFLRALPGIEMLRGNTDRYVLTGEQPAPHATAADPAGISPRQDVENEPRAPSYP